MIRKINYIKGQKEGKSESYYPIDGKLYEEENYKNDILDGEYKSYYRNGKIHTIGYHTNGVRSGEWKDYSENGKNIGIYTYNQNGRLDGKIIYYIPTDFSQKSYFRKETEYRDGILEGSYIVYDTKDRITEKGFHRNNEKDGQWIKYVEGKIIYEENYRNGRRDGVQRYYYTNGKVSEEYVYNYGKEIEVRRYDENGNLKYERKR